MTHPGPAPLSARSVLLSVLLGSHPPRLPVRTLVRTAEMFGISEGTARVALSRLSADGEVTSDDGTYALSERHLQRQSDQDAALRPTVRPWRGGWVLAVQPPEVDGRAAQAGSPISVFVSRRRMAELRPGVWTRPDNLAPGTVEPPEGLLLWSGRPQPGGPGPGRLAATLWDLDGWAARAERLLGDMAAAHEPAKRVSVAATMVRHIRDDPVLPSALLPPGWPGDRLRRAYDAYRAELGELIAGLRDG